MNDNIRNNYFIQDWMKHMSLSVKRMFPDINDGKLNEYLEKVIDDNIDVPIGTLDNNYTGNARRIDVLTLMQWVKDKNFIVAGNGTFFKQHKDEYNPVIHFLQYMQTSRKNIKNAMKKETPGTYDYLIKDMGQQNEKLIMNSEYGASGSPITYFFNIHCAGATTATGQSMISTAMCTFEDFFSDNVRFIDYDDCTTYINKALEDECELDTSILIDKRPDQVFERLKSKFLNHKQEYDYLLFNMILSLSQVDLNRLYYKNNLYEFCRIPRIKKLLFEISQKTGLFLNPNILPENAAEDMHNLWTYLENFVVYNHFAFNRIGRLTCDPRDTVATIDTDSNMLTMSPWVDFMFDDVLCGDKEMLSRPYKELVYMFINTSCYLATQLIKKHLKFFGENSNIPDDYLHKLDMKNEFLFETMILTDVKKRYMSKVLLREGEIFEKYDVKGLKKPLIEVIL